MPRALSAVHSAPRRILAHREQGLSSLRTSNTTSLMSVFRRVYGTPSAVHSSATGAKSMPSKPSSTVIASSESLPPETPTATVSPGAIMS